MRRKSPTLSFALVALVALVALTGVVPACVTNCTEAACQTGVSFELAGAAATAAARISVCRMSECAEVTIPGEEGQCSETLNGSLLLAVCVRNEGVSVSYEFSATPQPSDGERYTVTVVDGSGNVVLQKETVALYEDVYPNGPECSGHCRVAELSLD